MKPGFKNRLAIWVYSIPTSYTLCGQVAYAWKYKKCYGTYIFK